MTTTPSAAASERRSAHRSAPRSPDAPDSAIRPRKSTIRQFTRLGTPGLHATWLRPALFVSGLSADPHRDDRRGAVSIGGQADVRFTVLSNLDMTLSAGAAVAFDRGRPRREAMLSLKVLR